MKFRTVSAPEIDAIGPGATPDKSGLPLAFNISRRWRLLVSIQTFEAKPPTT